MKIEKANYRDGEIKIRVENKDDLWYLSQIVDIGDYCSGRTFRKIKVGSDENAKTIKKAVFLEICVEKIEFHNFSGNLRLSGKILVGTEEIPQGQYHTFDVEEDSVISLKKEKFYKYQIEKIKEASKNEYSKIMVAVIDRGDAIFALLKKYGYDVITEIQGEIEHKTKAVQPKEEFFESALIFASKLIKEHEVHYTIIACPSMWSKRISELSQRCGISSNVAFAICHSSGKTGIDEVLKSKEVIQALQNERTSKEMSEVEDLLKNISLGKLFSYGFSDVESKVNMGGVKTLLVTDGFIKKKRSSDNFQELDNLLNLVEKTNGKIMIVSSENDAGKKLDGLSGIGAILRYDLE